MKTCECCNKSSIAHGLCKSCYEKMTDLLEKAQSYQLSDNVQREHGFDKVEMGKSVICSGCGKWKIHVKNNLCIGCFFEYCESESERKFWD